MKKQLSLLIVAVLVSIPIMAQKNAFIDGKYSRNSVSIIVVNHGDSYDNAVNLAVREYTNEKFDFNDIETKTIKTSIPRIINAEEKNIKLKYDDGDVKKWLKGKEIGKEIFSYWFNRSSDGTMTDERVLERGKLNATDQDLKIAMATKIGKELIAEKGYELLERSYTIIFDAYAINNGDVNTINVYAIIYKMDFSKSTMDKIFKNCWVEETDDRETIANKNKYYDKIKIPIEERMDIKEVSVGENLTKSVSNALESILSNKKMKEWKVATPILGANPLLAKIGKKEGVRNGQRFDVYKYVEDKDGNLMSKRTSQVRAANTIVDNRGITTGETQPTTFYKISMGNLQPGMMLVENKDWKTGLYLGGVIGGGTTDQKMYGAVNVGLNYLIYLKTFGGSRFAMFHYALADYVSKYNNISAGYGLGFRPARKIEIMPYIKATYSKKKGDDDIDSGSSKKFGADGGLGLNLLITKGTAFGIKLGYSSSLDVYFGAGLRFNL